MFYAFLYQILNKSIKKKNYREGMLRVADVHRAKIIIDFKCRIYQIRKARKRFFDERSVTVRPSIN